MWFGNVCLFYNFYFYNSHYFFLFLFVMFLGRLSIN